MTHYELIKRMTKEELAGMLDCRFCKERENDGDCSCRCIQNKIDWLNEEYKK